MPQLVKLHRRLSERGLVVIGVHTTGGAEKMADFVRDNEIDFPVAADSGGKTVGAYSVDSYPDYYLIDRRGVLRVADLANSDVERAVEVLLAESASGDPAGAKTAPATATHELRPIDFARLDRSIAKTPELGADARFGLFLFGLQADKRVWAILDRSEGTTLYDTLYLDCDADGDVGEDGERFTGKAQKGATVFEVGDFTDPGTGAVHKDLRVTWTPASVRYRMLWRGEKVTMGCYGPERDTYQGFAATPEEAPVFVPGWDRPFAFEHWMSGTLERGKTTDFKVFVGNRGDRRGAFSCVDDEFLPVDDSPVATLIYADKGGKEQRFMVKLRERC